MRIHPVSLISPIVGVSMVGLILGNSIGWNNKPVLQPLQPLAAEEIAQIQSTQTGNPHTYWVDGQQNRVRLVPQQIAFRPGLPPEQVLRSTLTTLLQGQPSSSLHTTIPAGTQLLGLRVNGSEISVNLSHEFEQGGGSTAMLDRVAQVLYTATSLNPQAKVFLSIEGQLLDDNHPLGGEGVVLSQPMTREGFRREFTIP